MGSGMNIFLDLETVPDGEKPTTDQLTPPGTYKKADSIAAWYADKEARDEDLDNIYRKRSLPPAVYTEGRVLCIAYAVNDGPIEGLINDNEEQLFKDFEKELGKHDGVYRAAPRVIGFNGFSFDFPITHLRACKYGCRDLAVIFRPPSRDFLVDCMKLFLLTDHSAKVSLDNACKFFGIPTSKDLMSGAEVYDNYLAGKTKEILKYCQADVVALGGQVKEKNLF
jgi:predicted PolB exonuclease-like 3'-5' exonuclease